MRLAAVCIVAGLLPAVPARAGYVDHSSTAPGIVAFTEPAQFSTPVLLDSFGRVWFPHDSQPWDRAPDRDVPFPVSQIRFWDYGWLVTVQNEVWAWAGDSDWNSYGFWPGVAGIEANSTVFDPPASAFPNPSPGSCRVSFRLESEGPSTVRLFDAAGRGVRQLLDGSQPAGDYFLEWDGRDDSGAELPAGVYVFRVSTASGEQSGRVVLAR